MTVQPWQNGGKPAPDAAELKTAKPPSPQTRNLRNGRRTKAQELDLYFESLGTTRDDFEAGLATAEAAGMPDTPEGMRQELIRQIWTDLPKIKSDAARQAALKTLLALGAADGPADPDQPEPLIADVIAGIEKLPPERKHEILTAELDRLDMEQARIREVLDAQPV